MKRTLVSLAVFTLLALVSGCSGEDPPAQELPEDASGEATAVSPTSPPPDDSTGPTFGQAEVENIELMILESFPVQVQVAARGVLPDNCTSLDQTVTQREGNRFQVVITTVRQPDAAECIETEIPFEETVSLDVLGLDAGTYDVVVNGISGSFTLDVDNRIEEATAVPEESGRINGRVWHDLCAAIEGLDTEPSAGCITLDDGTVRADGVPGDDEPGIEGVLVNLGRGACPSTGLATTTTDAAGSRQCHCAGR